MTDTLKIEADTDGITISQVGTKTYSIGNGERCDMVFISDEQLPAFAKVIQSRLNKINQVAWGVPA
jgi:hypothetical protein